MTFRLLFFSLLCCCTPALAQHTYVQSSLGTGFYINREGHLITNAHVVRSCQSITVKGPSGTAAAATLVTRDDGRDLAILKTSGTSQAIAPLRWNIKDLKPGDPLYLYGFPGEAGMRGEASFGRTRLLGMQGPAGEPDWLQLQNLAQHGNSGGPVLDSSGHVIAVITGSFEQAPQLANGTIGAVSHRTDAAIPLAALQDFLRRHQVPYYEAASGLVAYADELIAKNASHFVFRVQCVRGTVQY